MSHINSGVSNFGQKSWPEIHTIIYRLEIRGEGNPHHFQKSIKIFKHWIIRKVRVFIERAKDGSYRAYMPDNNNLAYGVIWEGSSAEAAKEDLLAVYEAMISPWKKRDKREAGILRTWNLASLSTFHLSWDTTPISFLIKDFQVSQVFQRLNCLNIYPAIVFPLIKPQRRSKTLYTL